MADENRKLDNPEQEEIEVGAAQGEQQQEGNEGNEGGEQQVSAQELLVEIAKLKRERDKNASEAAKWKKEFRATQSVQEVANAEKAEAEARRQEEFDSMKRELTINRLEKTYLAMQYTPEEASKMAVAEADGDFEAKVKIMSEVDARKKKSYEAEWLASRPEINTGGGSGNDEDPFIKGFNM